MRSFTSMFRTAPSAEFTRTDYHGVQLVWKRLFEHLVERADVYKRTGFSNMHGVHKELDENVYLDLRVTHDALSLERDELMDAFQDPEKLTSALVSRANTYKSRTKAFFIDVQKALEVAHDKSDSPWSLVESLASYQFPERLGSGSSYTQRAASMTLHDQFTMQQISEDVASEAMSRLHITTPSLSQPERTSLETGGYTYSALGLYNLQPGLPTFEETMVSPFEEAPPFPEPIINVTAAAQPAHGSGTDESRQPDWLDDLLRGVPGSTDTPALRELLMSLPPNPDEQMLGEFATIVHVFAPALDGRSIIHEFVRRRASVGPGWQDRRRLADQSVSAANPMVCPPTPEITPLRLRTFPFRTHDILEEEQ